MKPILPPKRRWQEHDALSFYTSKLERTIQTCYILYANIHAKLIPCYISKNIIMKQIWCLMVLLFPLLCQETRNTATLDCIQIDNTTIEVSLTSNKFPYKAQTISSSSNITCALVSNSSMSFPLGYKFICQGWCCTVQINQLPPMCAFEKLIKLEMDMLQMWQGSLMSLNFGNYQQFSNYWCGQCDVDFSPVVVATIVGIVVGSLVLVGLIVLCICCRRVKARQQQQRKAQRKKKKEREEAYREKYQEEAMGSAANIPTQKIQVIYP